MKRREFLVLSSAAAIALMVQGCGGTSSQVIQNTSQSRLHIPPLLPGVLRDGIMHYDLNIVENIHVFFEGTTTKTFGINGSFLGPTLQVRNGTTVSMNYTNKLKEATTMHGHGMHVPAIMDGGVHQVIEPDMTWSATYTVKQKACTNWYHAHFMGKTAEHVYKGLAGMIIVEDEQSAALDLPKTYGVDDIPLILQDRFFDADFEFDYSPNMMEVMHGYHGDVFLVNGVVNPYVEAEAKEIRFRILNGSNSTVYDLGFDDGRSFKQIATDNAFLESPVTLTQLPEVLTRLERYSVGDAVHKREFRLSGRRGRFFINGVAMDKERIDETVPLNQIEVWEVVNEMNVHHNFHIHATHFVVVERNGSKTSVADNEKGYKDTVFLAPNDRVTLIVKMTDYTDASNPYMYHCHFLEHEDAGMMGQFVVL